MIANTITPAGAHRRHVFSKGAKLFLALFWLIAVVGPLVTMLSTMAEVDVIATLTARKFSKALRQSVTVSAVATVIAVSLAGLLAWCTCRTRLKHRGIFSVLFSLPMLIPSISHGMGLVILFGANGLITNLLGARSAIYGFTGIVIGSVMYAFPVAYLMLLDVLRYEDFTPYEAAQVLGISKLHQFTAITLPYLRKPLISVVFATFTLIVTDYGVPLMVGGKYTTLPVMMYQDVIGLMEFGKGSVIGLVLLIPAFIACLLDVLNRDKASAAFTRKAFVIRKNRGRDLFAGVVCTVTALCVLLPIVTFACISFVKKYPLDMSFSLDNVLQALQMRAGQYFLNSLLIALGVSLLGVALATATAYLTARMPSRFSRWLHLMAILPLAVPGIVLGLSYVMFFKGTVLQGTFAILVLVNTMHFFSSPYLMMYNTFSKLNVNLEAVGATLGVSRWRILLDVLLPQSADTLAEMAGYFFVNSMMTISAVSFLANVSTKPVALMITQFEGQMQLECAAFVSLMILFANVLVKALVYAAKRALHARG